MCGDMLGKLVTFIAWLLAADHMYAHMYPFTAKVGIVNAEMQIGMGAARGALYLMHWGGDLMHHHKLAGLYHRKCCKEVLGMPGVVRIALQDTYVVNNRSVYIEYMLLTPWRQDWAWGQCRTS